MGSFEIIEVRRGLRDMNLYGGVWHIEILNGKVSLGGTVGRDLESCATEKEGWLSNLLTLRHHMSKNLDFIFHVIEFSD